MQNNESQRLVKGALLLTIAGLISKVLSASYRIPLQNLTGDMGYYIYQQVYPLLGVMVILALYGFPAAVSTLAANMKTQDKGLSLRNFYLPLFFLMLVINGGFFILLYLNAPKIAELVGDTELTRAYQLASFVFLCIPLTSLLRGSFQGVHQMKPTAYSQVGEQLVRVSLIIFVAYLFYVKRVSLYTIGEGAALAALSGALIASFILLFYFFKIKPISHESFKIPWTYYIRTLLGLGIVASLNHMVLLIIQFADLFTLVPALIKSGLTDVQAMEAKGIFDRGQPLIQLGPVIGSSFALALIPAISRKQLDNQPNKMITYIQRALLFSFYLAAGASIGLIIIFPEVNMLLFKDLKGTLSLQIMALGIVLSAISITMASILQSLGHFKRTAAYVLIAFVIKTLANYYLVPLLGITGSALSTIISLFVLCAILLMRLKYDLPDLSLLKVFNVKAFIIAGFGMTALLLIIKTCIPYILISSRLILLIYVIVLSILGAILYFLLLLRFRAFTERELAMLPLASLLIKIHRGRDCE